MKKTIRFFSLALAILLILPTLAALPIKVKATEPAIGYHKTYASAGDYAVRMYLMNASGVSADYVEKTFHINNTIMNFDKFVTFHNIYACTAIIVLLSFIIPLLM